MGRKGIVRTRRRGLRKPLLADRGSAGGGGGGGGGPTALSLVGSGLEHIFIAADGTNPFVAEDWSATSGTPSVNGEGELGISAPGGGLNLVEYVGSGAASRTTRMVQTVANKDGGFTGAKLFMASPLVSVGDLDCLAAARAISGGGNTVRSQEIDNGVATTLESNGDQNCGIIDSNNDFRMSAFCEPDGEGAVDVYAYSFQNENSRVGTSSILTGGAVWGFGSEFGGVSRHWDILLAIATLHRHLFITGLPNGQKLVLPESDDTEIDSVTGDGGDVFIDTFNVAQEDIAKAQWRTAEDDVLDTYEEAGELWGGTELAVS